MKAKFENVATIAKTENTCGEHSFLTFKKWEKNGAKRIYINDYKRRTLGYIENGNVIIKDRQGNTQSEIDFAIAKFNEAYEV